MAKFLTILRDYVNPQGEVFDAQDVERWYAEDALEVKGAIQDGTKDIQTKALFTLEGVNLVCSGAKPSADASSHKTLWLEAGGPGVPDKVQVVLKKTDDTYAWFDIIQAT